MIERKLNIKSKLLREQVKVIVAKKSETKARAKFTKVYFNL